MTQRTPSLGELLRTAVQNGLAEVFVSMPGTVQAYYPNQQSADIVLGFQRPLRDRNENRVLGKFPVLPRVPVMFLQGGGFFLKTSVQKGDHVWVNFAYQSMSNWFGSQDGAVDAVDDRLHSLSGASCFPVTLDRSGAGPFGHLAMGADDGKQLHVTEARVNLGSEAPPWAVALGEKVDIELDKIRNALTAAGVTATGGLTAADVKAQLSANPRQATGSQTVKADG